MDDTGTYLAAAALIVSVISLIYTAISLRHSRQHNRLSVKPIPYVLPRDFEEFIEVAIVNKGTGPLIAHETRFSDLNGRSADHLVDLLPMLRHGQQWSNFSKPRNMVLAPDESKVLMRFEGNPSDERFKENRDMLRESLSGITMYLSYTSVYGEKKAMQYNYSLDWFGRH